MYVPMFIIPRQFRIWCNNTLIVFIHKYGRVAKKKIISVIDFLNNNCSHNVQLLRRLSNYMSNKRTLVRIQPRPLEIINEL